MSSNNQNWAPNTSHILETVSEYDNVAHDMSDDNENARLLENHTLSPNIMTNSNGNGLSTSINIEFFNENSAVNNNNNNRNPTRSHSGGQFIRQQFYTFLNDARTFLTPPNNEIVTQQIQQIESEPEIATIGRIEGPEWWRNFDNFFSMLPLPNAFNFRVTTNNSLPNLTHQRAQSASSTTLLNEDRAGLSERVSSLQRRSSLIEHVATNDARSEEDDREHTHNAADEQQLLVQCLTNFLRYVPFLCVLLIKFIHDHLFNLLDIMLQQFVIFQINKSLCRQISKLAQKNYYILVRDFLLVTAIVVLRFQIAAGPVDPFGLLITPPHQYIPILTTNENVQQLTESLVTKKDIVLENITETISLSMILVYVIVNDLILKLLTILIKIAITMLPTNLLQSKPRVSF